MGRGIVGSGIMERGIMGMINKVYFSFCLYSVVRAIVTRSI